MIDRSIPARAKEAGVSTRTLYREIARGEGPPVTHVSERRRIIEDLPWAAWLRKRRRRKAHA